MPCGIKGGTSIAAAACAEFPLSAPADETGDDPVLSVIRREESKVLDACLARLPADLREAVVLRFYQDLSFEDVSQVLQVSLSAAKMRVYRGLEKLRGMMSEEEQAAGERT